MDVNTFWSNVGFVLCRGLWFILKFSWTLMEVEASSQTGSAAWHISMCVLRCIYFMMHWCCSWQIHVRSLQEWKRPPETQEQELKAGKGKACDVMAHLIQFMILNQNLGFCGMEGMTMYGFGNFMGHRSCHVNIIYQLICQHCCFFVCGANPCLHCCAWPTMSPCIVEHCDISLGQDGVRERVGYCWGILVIKAFHRMWADQSLQFADPY